jgi:hypothetical protein
MSSQQKARSAALIALVMLLGGGSFLLVRFLLDEDLYRVVLSRLGLLVVLPLTVFFLVLAAHHRGRPAPRFERLAFRVAFLVLLLGVSAGLFGAIAIRAHLVIVTTLRQTLGAMGLAGFCASIAVGQKLLRDSGMIRIGPNAGK